MVENSSNTHDFPSPPQYCWREKETVTAVILFQVGGLECPVEQQKRAAKKADRGLIQVALCAPCSGIPASFLWWEKQMRMIILNTESIANKGIKYMSHFCPSIPNHKL